MSRLIDIAGTLKDYLEQVGSGTDGLATAIRNQTAAIERLRKGPAGTPESKQALGEIESTNKAMVQQIEAINKIDQPTI